MHPQTPPESYQLGRLHLLMPAAARPCSQRSQTGDPWEGGCCEKTGWLALPMLLLIMEGLGSVRKTSRIQVSEIQQREEEEA